MMKDERVREVAAAMARESGEEFESLRVDGQLFWYCRAEFTVKALEAAGYEVRRKAQGERRKAKGKRRIIE